MGLAWQQGPLGAGSISRFLTAQPMPERLLFAEDRLRRGTGKPRTERIIKATLES